MTDETDIFLLQKTTIPLTLNSNPISDGCEFGVTPVAVEIPFGAYNPMQTVQYNAVCTTYVTNDSVTDIDDIVPTIDFLANKKWIDRMYEIYYWSIVRKSSELFSSYKNYTIEQDYQGSFILVNEPYMNIIIRLMTYVPGIMVSFVQVFEKLIQGCIFIIEIGRKLRVININEVTLQNPIDIAVTIGKNDYIFIDVNVHPTVRKIWNAHSRLLESLLMLNL